MPAKIITISRQYGSGGREVGEKLAKELGYAYYDKEVIRRAVAESDIHEEFIERDDESIGNMFSYFLSFANGSVSKEEESLPLPDRVFLIQSRVIKQITCEGPCVIIGRCADYVLRDYPNLLSVLIYSDSNSRLKRVMQRNNLSEKGAIARLKKTDRSRQIYYEQYTDMRWGDAFNYDISLSTSTFGVDHTVAILKDIALNR